MLDKNDAVLRGKYPIAARLEEEIENSIERQFDKFLKLKDLIESHKDALFLRRYVYFYGDQIIKMLFILKVWLERENVLPSSVLSIWQLGRLLIRLGLGDLLGNPTIDYEKSLLMPTTMFQQWISKKEDADEAPILRNFDMGTMMLEFLRYLAR